MIAGVLEIQIMAGVARVQADMDAARRLVGSAMGDIDKMAAQAKAALGAIGGSISLGMLSGMIKEAIDIQDHLNDLSKSTGLAVDQLAGLGSVARKSGGDLESIAASVSKLAVNMGKDAEKFAKLGVTAKDPLEAFKQLADVFAAVKDPQERAAFGAAALGKSWAGAAPLLAEGSSRIQELVDKGMRLSGVTAESAKAADDLNDQLEDLNTALGGTKMAFANSLVPSLLDTAKAMQELTDTGHPLLALLRGFAGLGKTPWDLALGSVDMSMQGQMKDLTQSLSDLERKRDNLLSAGGGVLNKWLYGTKDDLDQQIIITRNQLEALKKYGDQLGKKPSIDPTTGRGADVRGFIAGDSSTSAQLTEGQRLIEQLKARWIATQNLSELEKLEAQFAEARYAKTTAGERDIALGIAGQIDARKSLMTELDAELARVKELSAAYSAQDARLNSLIGGTDIGRNTQAMLDAALAESALSSGKIDTSTYDQIIAQLHGVKAEGIDTFKELQNAIDGWGKQSASAIADFCVDGSASFSGLATSIIKDMMRMIVQQNITGPMAAAVGGIDFGRLLSGITLPSFAVGTDYVPHDMVAQIHKGERITPAAFNPANGGGGPSGSSVTISINPTYHIDSRSDRASVMGSIAASNERLKADILASMQRGGVFA